MKKQPAVSGRRSAKAKPVKLACFTIPDGRGGTIRVQMSKAPNAQTIASLQELVAVARAEAEKRGLPGESRTMAKFRMGRRGR